MIRARFLARLAAVVALIGAGTAASTGAAYADEVSPAVEGSTADRASSLPPGAVRADEGARLVPRDGHAVQAAWDCLYGYPCLYDGDNGTGSNPLALGCGFHDLGAIARPGGGYYNDWANSARTQGNSITVYNWTGSYWDDWGTVPSWQQWNFQLKNQIDGVLVNC